MIDVIVACIFGCFVGFVIGLAIGVRTFACPTTCKSDIALKLANTMNSSMLDCVIKQVITKEQVHDIETIFHKHIEENFKGIKAQHSSDEEK
jgi:hypothetical protein